MIGVESCDRCGFERGEWNEQDANRTLAHAEELLVGWCDGATGRLDEKLEARRIDDLKAITAAEDLFDKVHHLMHGLVSLADVRRAAGDAVPHQRGSVAALNTSSGGVPKTRIDDADVERRGIVGDVQSTRLHHGRPWQALCLWSAEVIDDFAAAGHPLEPGRAGENVTIAGVDWSTLRGGTIIDIGDVRCQLSAPATPCKKNAPWFLDGDFMVMDHDRHPGTSRWYASVLRPGTITTGAPVTVSPF
ncbi:MAG: MOSC domain-containing protein [Ilumatobacter sp.]|uniref:MOSC domain-containing protein n=1 Tax=Ilumatobacter sp. TaxID=1967498 RepID=UPI00391D88AE